MTPAVGAQVDGLDLTRPLSDTDADRVRAALARHLVLFFRDQPLDKQQQLTFAGIFGEPYPQNVNASGREPMMSVTLEDTPDSPPKADHWHTDIPFVSQPPDVAVLLMRATPAVGGDTLWASLYAVHDALSTQMRRRVADLRVEVRRAARLRHAGPRPPGGAEPVALAAVRRGGLGRALHQPPSAGRPLPGVPLHPRCLVGRGAPSGP